MTNFRVTWEIDIEAETPTEAAKQARQYQLDGGAEVGYFRVHWLNHGYPTEADVDLDAPCET